MEQAGIGSVALRSSAWLDAVNNIVGSPISDVSGQNIGRLVNLIVDNASGQIAYLVAQFDLVTGSSCYFPLPWRVIHYSGNKGYVFIAPSAILQHAPRFPGDTPQSWKTSGWRGAVEDYYRAQAIP